MNVSPPENLKDILHKSLAKLERFEECALLDYPNYLNLGDHLIWMGTILYLNDILKTKIKYVANLTNFSGEAMEKEVGNAPIFLSGGGNFGDLWPNIQKFREKIITQYKDKPIIILPQSIYFANPDNLKRSAKVINQHPNLILFTRDNYSHKIAIENFCNAQVIKAPDMAFEMLGMPGLQLNYKPKDSILYLYRQDRELNEKFSPDAIAIPNLVVEDWVSFKWVYGHPDSKFNQSIATLVREFWQRGLKTPDDWISRQKWQQSHPYIAKFNGMYNSAIHRKSWSFIHSGIYQFYQHRLIITNRLHGHILCIILGIPHIFLPNSYYKNEGFYESWTKLIPFCRFVKEPGQIKSTAKELMELFPRGML